MIISKDGFNFNNHLYLTTCHCYIRPVHMSFKHFDYAVIGGELKVYPIDGSYYPELVANIGELLFRCFQHNDSFQVQKNGKFKTIIAMIVKNDTFIKSVDDHGFMMIEHDHSVEFINKVVGENYDRSCR